MNSRLTATDIVDGVNLRKLRALESKFTHWQTYAAEAAGHTRRLRLGASKPLRVLDLGSAFGYFCRACTLLGHDAEGVDDLAVAPVYRVATGLLGVYVHAHRVSVEKPLPDTVTGLYDLITMHCFGLPCCSRQEFKRPIGAEFWPVYAETISQILRRLKPGGLFDSIIHYDRVGWLCDRMKWAKMVGDRGTGSIEGNIVQVKIREG